MKNTNAEEISSTGAVVVWNEGVAKQVREDILAGRGVRKELAKVAPKKWLQEVRARRKSDLTATSGAILGQFTQEGWKIVSMSDKKVSERTGDMRVTVGLVKRAETEADKLRKEVEELRAQLSVYEAKKA
jgi:hypothetical protein